MRDFDFPDICWKCNTVERNQTRRFLRCVEENYVIQMLREASREGSPLDLLVLNIYG